VRKRIPKGELLPEGHNWILWEEGSSVLVTAACTDCDQAMIYTSVSSKQIENHKTLRSCECHGEYWLMLNDN